MRLILLAFLTTSLFAQRGVPSAVFHGPQKAQQGAPVTADERAAKRVRPDLTQIGIHRGVTAADLEGGWQTTRDGSSIWRLVLRSPGAAAMRLHLENFHAGADELWLTELHGDQPQSFGPYTGDGVHADGEFWTNASLGEAVLVEYQTNLLQTSSRSRSLPFRISEISHLTDLPIQLGKPSPDMGLAKTGDSRAAALACNIDVNCRPEYAELARAVA